MNPADPRSDVRRGRLAVFRAAGSAGLALVIGIAVLSLPVGARAPSQPGEPGAAQAHLPMALTGPIARVTPLPSPIPGETSRVLSAVPVPPSARLTFYLQDPNAPGGGFASAKYVVSGTTRTEAIEWMKARLPSYGWQEHTNGPDWVRYPAHHLRVRAYTTAEGTELQLTADAASAATADTSLTGLPLPPSTRRRFDPLDLLAEELAVPGPASEAYAAFSGTLAADGWVPDDDRWLGTARVGRFVRADERILLAAWDDLHGAGAEVAIGPAGCLPPAALEATRSVYLQDVAGAPGGALVAYRWMLEDQLAIEYWQEGCVDLDLLGGLLAAGAGDGWEAQSVGRGPGQISLDLVPDAAHTVTVRADASPGGEVAVEFWRHEDGRARTSGASLLSPDVPLPPRAEALLMTVNAPGWRHREEYHLPGFGLVATTLWLQDRLPAAGWEFERLEPNDRGSGLVFYRQGAEILMELADGRVAIQRRRSCPDGIGRIPAGDPVETRWLLEVPAVPRAAFDGWVPPVERYRLTCADLGLLTDWYRARMEEGNWALAGTSTPSALARDLLFVRPSELGLPHDQRTAWAGVLVRRVWPYHYEIALSRDPAGIRAP